MSTENTNTQAQVPPPAPPAGPSVEELQTKLAEFERTREGLIRDLQHERKRAQEAESRLNPPAPSADKPDVTQDELGKVLRPYTEPALKEIAAIRSQLAEERAKTLLASKSGRRWEEIEADKAFQEKLSDVAKRYNLIGSADVVVSRAYDILELEGLKAKEAERVRTATAASQASMPSGAPPAPAVSGKKYSADEFNGMHWKTFDSMSAEGRFKKLADGSFEFAPTK